ncbi:MAG: hypothetical protein LQ348_007445, partial [Seirophora lacunosa]
PTKSSSRPHHPSPTTTTPTTTINPFAGPPSSSTTPGGGGGAGGSGSGGGIVLTISIVGPTGPPTQPEAWQTVRSTTTSAAIMPGVTPEFGGSVPEGQEGGGAVGDGGVEC